MLTGRINKFSQGSVLQLEVKVNNREFDPCQHLLVVVKDVGERNKRAKAACMKM